MRVALRGVMAVSALRKAFNGPLAASNFWASEPANDPWIKLT